MIPVKLRHLFPTLACLSGCALGSAPPAPATLAAARAAGTTTVRLQVDGSPPVVPPAGVLELTRFPGPLGEHHAYVTPMAAGPRRPAMVWIAGGFDWGIGPSAWEPQDRANDQSARAFREAGMVLLLPALRGSNGNPGENECMYGEVDDVVAAARWLATRPDVDPARIYLGGHSTGGTLALLVAESSTVFRGVFAFGPVADVRDYGPTACLADDAPTFEWQARAPGLYASRITTPTWVIEGKDGNVASARAIGRAASTAPVTTVLVPGHDHFSVLAPGTEAVAAAILGDTGAGPALDAAAIVARR